MCNYHQLHKILMHTTPFAVWYTCIIGNLFSETETGKTETFAVKCSYFNGFVFNLTYLLISH